MRKKKDEYDELFSRFWEVYPRRHRQDDKFEAWMCWRARMNEKKVDPETLIACANEYAIEIRRLGKFGTEFVLRAATFLGPRHRYEPYLPQATDKAIPVTRKPPVLAEPPADNGEALVSIRSIIESLARAKTSPVKDLKVRE